MVTTNSNNMATMQINELLSALERLNDYNGNKGALNDLDFIFTGFMSSDECEETDGRQRANLMLYYIQLRDILLKSNFLTKQIIESLSTDAL